VEHWPTKLRIKAGTNALSFYKIEIHQEGNDTPINIATNPGGPKGCNNA